MPATHPPSATCLAVAYRPGEQRFARIAHLPGAIWLDSGAAPQADAAGFEIIACEPRHRQQISLQQVVRPGSAQPSVASADPFDFIRRQHRPGPAPAAELPFCGGLIGYLGYDLNRGLERLAGDNAPATEAPVAWVGYFGWALVQHRQRRQAWLVADGDDALAEASAMLDRLDEPSGDSLQTTFGLQTPWRASTDRAHYLDAVQSVRRLIAAGDCYQVNLARHYQARYAGSPWRAYRALRAALPAPFSAFINTGSSCLLSHSPERFLRVEDGQVLTSPIKGTRPRAADPTEDRRQALDLLASAKDRAENVMIVDLLRNDLGRSCRPGSISAAPLFELESHANVHHLVSTVRGELRADIDAVEALKRAFPGGSITGAPKIRAMEIIGELEPVARSAYCGSVFYYSNHGRLDSSIAIRSIIADGERVHCWGGGGIVYDSDSELEYAEIDAKIRVLLDTLSAM